MEVKTISNFSFLEKRIERYPGEDEQHYSRYKAAHLIEDDIFNKVIKSMGGYVYNLCVGVVGKYKIFNGITWVGIHSDSYDKNDELISQFEAILLEAGWN